MTGAAQFMIVDILDAIDRSGAPLHEKISLRAQVERIGAAHGLRSLRHRERIAAARRLLDDRQPRTLIRERLMSRFSISRSAAYRVIDAALQLSQTGTDFGT